MNKNFKVVFSKARNALMVVNEATSSVQAKGTKTVIAVAVATVAGIASAAATNVEYTGDDITIEAGQEVTVTQKTTDEGTININGGKATLTGGFAVNTQADPDTGASLVMKGGELVVKDGNNFRNLQVTGGKIVIDGGDAERTSGWRAGTYLGGYAAPQGTEETRSTLISGTGTTVSVTNGMLYGGATGSSNSSKSPLLITNGATVTLGGSTLNKAGVIYTGTDKPLIVSDGAKVSVAKDQYGAIFSRGKITVDGGVIENAGTLVVANSIGETDTPNVNTAKVTDSVFSADKDVDFTITAGQFNTAATGLTVVNGKITLEGTGAITAQKLSAAGTPEKVDGLTGFNVESLSIDENASLTATNGVEIGDKGAIVLNDGSITTDSIVVKSGGAFTLSDGSINFVKVQRAPTQDFTVQTGGTFTVNEGAAQAFNTMTVEGGSTNSIKGRLDVQTLTVDLSGNKTSTPFSLTDQGELVVKDMTVDGSGLAVAIDAYDDSAVVLTGKIDAKNGTRAVVARDNSTITLGDDAEVTGKGAIYMYAGTTLGTNSQVFRDDDGKVLATAPDFLEFDNGAAKSNTTISLTDSTMSIEDIKSLNTMLGKQAGTAIQATTIWNNNTDKTTLSELALSEWKDLGGTVIGALSATVDNAGQLISISNDASGYYNFGAKNLVVSGATADQPLILDVWGTNNGVATLVGGAAGTELIVAANGESVPSATNIKVNGTLNFGDAAGLAATYGHLNGHVEVGENVTNTAHATFNVSNGSFEIKEYVKTFQYGDVTIDDDATLTVHNVMTSGNTPTLQTASVVNAGTFTVEGTLNAETIDNDGTFTVSHTGRVNADAIQGTSTVNGGVVVLGVEKRTGTGETGFNAAIGQISLNAAKVGENEAGDEEQQGALVVVGGNTTDAMAYQQAHHLDNTLWIGQETHFAAEDTVTLGTGGKGTWNGHYLDGNSGKAEKTVAIDMKSLASSGYKAGETLDKTAQIVNYGNNAQISADKLVLANFADINKSMLVLNETTDTYELVVGDVTDINNIDLGTSFYGATLDSGIVALNANEDRVHSLLDGLAVENEVVYSLNNFELNRNELVNAIVFKTDAWERSIADNFAKIAEDNGWTNVDGIWQQAEARAAWEAYESKAWAQYEDGIDSVSYMAVLGGAFSTAVDINNEVWKSLDRRMSLANLNAPRNAYGVTPWVDVIGTTNEAKDLFGGAGYEADIYGAVFGADWTAPCGAILGLAFNVGQADANSSDWSNKVENDVDFWGVSLYGSHRIGNFNGKVDLGYISTSNDLSTHTVLGKFDESLDADIFTIGFGGEYIVNAGSFNVVPHAGIRWSRIDMDDSKFGADYDAMNLFQMPMGVAFSGTFETAGMKVAPMIDISVVPAFGDKDAEASYMGGYKDATRVVDTNPIQMTLGVTGQVDAWTFGVNYGLTAGGDERLNNSFNLNARYTF